MSGQNKKIISFSGEPGLSLIELLVAMAIFGILVVGAITYHSTAYKSTTLNQDRAFAIQKAIQLTHELRGRASRGDIAISLSPYDDIREDENGVVLERRFSPALSLQVGSGLNDPADPISGNTKIGDNWKYLRQIDVKRFSYAEPAVTEEPRLVTVRIFYSDASNPNKGGLPLAEITTVMRSLGQTVPANQVFDLYVISIDNTPGWWLNLSTLRPVINDAVSIVESTNPGLRYVPHWITQNAFGRDKSYTPFININPNITTGTYDNVEPVYYYVGLLETTDGSPFWFYNPSFLRESKVNGRVSSGVGIPDSSLFVANPVIDPLVQENIENGGLLFDPLDPPNVSTGTIDDEHYFVVRYTLADYFNHAVRYPEELIEYCMRKFGSLPKPNTGLNVKFPNLWECLPDNPPPGLPANFVQRYTEPSLEPSLRMLLEQLYQNPAIYQNSLILNVHGELLPVPPMRNHSDPAKNPTPGGLDPRPTMSGFPYVRAITHPERLEYQDWNPANPTINTTIKLRVYSYLSFLDPTWDTAPDSNCGIGNPIYKVDAILSSDCNPQTISTTQTNLNNEVPIIIRISGMDFNSYNLADLSVDRITGNATTSYSISTAPTIKPLDDSSTPAINESSGMWYKAQKWPNATGPDIVVLLYNSPLRHGLAGNYTGVPHEDLNNNNFLDTGEDINGNSVSDSGRLYGMEYVPAPIENAFDDNNPNPSDRKNLTSPSNTNYKNTARWIINLANTNGVLNDKQLTIETRIAPRRATTVTTYLPDIAAAPEASPALDNQYITRALKQGYDPSNPDSYIPEGSLYINGIASSYTSVLNATAGTYNFVTANNVPSNVSRTYVWTGNISCVAAGINPCLTPATEGRAGYSGMEGLDFPYNPYRAPFTERFQFMGDPRHSPYLDVKQDHRYNWYFKGGFDASQGGTAGWSGFNQATNGWNGRISFDYPRFNEIYRMAILKSRSIYSNMLGWSFYYVDPGGAIGGDSAGLSVYPLKEQEWVRVPQTGFVNRPGDGNEDYISNYIHLEEIAYSRDGRTRIARQFNANPPTISAWYAKTWLGELYPDILTAGAVTTNFYNAPNISWSARGNLPTINLATSVLTFKMDTEDQTYLGYNASRSGQDDSPPSFFNNVEKLNHLSWGNPSTTSTFWTCQASNMAKTFNVDLANQIITNRPFKPDQNTETPPEFNKNPYQSPSMRTTVSTFSPFYYETPSTDPANPCNTPLTSYPNQLGSALLQARLNPNGNPIPDVDDQFGYFVISGLAPAEDPNPALAANPNEFLATFNLISLTYGFMLTGQPKHPVTGVALPTTLQGTTLNGIPQLPRVEVIGPDPADIKALTNPQTLEIKWEISWRRWDGQLYTPDYNGASFYETTPLYYVPMYYDGTDWRYIIGSNSIVPKSPDNENSRAPLPKEDGGKYDVAAASPFSEVHYLCRGANTASCPGLIAGILTSEQFTWNIGGLNLPLDQDYTIRVVVHRKDIRNHFAYHDLKIRLRS
jgi:prepilin-type N-terminal cleavage/methylation domain-containing protein